MVLGMQMGLNERTQPEIRAADYRDCGPDKGGGNEITRTKAIRISGERIKSSSGAEQARETRRQCCGVRPGPRAEG